MARHLLSTMESVTAGELAAEAGVSRQAAHYHLVRMMHRGEVERRGRGRGTRYVRTYDLARTYALPELEEDRVWREVLDGLPAIRDLRPSVVAILQYAFTEMLNNAIDHSGGSRVDVVFWVPSDMVAFEVIDDGIGVFRHIRETWGLPDDFAAIQELSKGKATTAPDRHSGEGIFFTSKAVDRFEIESGVVAWIIDNRRGDQAVGDTPPRRGTRVRCEVDSATERTLTEVFAGFTNADSLRFDRSSLRVALFETGTEFISRSEAKRLATRLEGFSEVVLDFAGVRMVGQGFVDEVFRVWARANPETRLIPVNMSPAVAWMVGRATS